MGIGQVQIFAATISSSCPLGTGGEASEDELEEDYFARETGSMVVGGQPEYLIHDFTPAFTHWSESPSGPLESWTPVMFILNPQSPSEAAKDITPTA